MSKILNKSYQRILLLLFFIIHVSCEPDRKNYKFSLDICYDITIEVYEIAPGIGSESHSYFITDSNNFRYYFGYASDDEIYGFECQDSLILGIHMCSKFGQPYEPCDTIAVSITELKKLNNYHEYEEE